ncbi:MAG: DUF111 family protein [Myxococcaceae bacterium]|nr:DUF111 family protein [Myxococcaceae bacterium]MBH2005985.1 DUF111 family protein [Myxococcaceae bacterium]
MLHFEIRRGSSLKSLSSALHNLNQDFRPEFSQTVVSDALALKAQKLLQDVSYLLSDQEREEINRFFRLLCASGAKVLSCCRIPIAGASPELLALSVGIPVYEHPEEEASCDILAFAVLKTCVGYFGPRGSSTLKRFALSDDKRVQVLLCENSDISSRASDDGQPRVEPLIQIEALISEHSTLQPLLERLSQIGIKQYWTATVHEKANFPQSLLCMVAKASDKFTILEAIFIVGNTSEARVHLIEQHQLQKRVSSVTLGSQQKLKICRITETLFGDRIIRVDPFPEDLRSICQSTQQAQEIVRADILDAWRESRA